MLYINILSSSYNWLSIGYIDNEVRCFGFFICMKKYFGEYFRYTESSMLFEGYLKNSKEIDRKIFAASDFEDFVYGQRKNKY